MSLQPGTCRSCKAPILWAKTVAGKSIPLDAESAKRVVISEERAAVVDTYMPHHATCPQGREWHR